MRDDRGIQVVVRSEGGGKEGWEGRKEEREGRRRGREGEGRKQARKEDRKE